MSHHEVRAFFRHYQRAFNRLDGDAVADLWHTPSGIAESSDGQGQLTWWQDAAPMRANMRALCAVYARAGFARTRFRIDSHTPMGRDHAHATLAWTLHRADGSVLQAFRTGYQLIRNKHGVRVLLATAFEEDLAAMQGSQGSQGAPA